MLGEEIRELREAIQRLTADQQEALSLRFAAGLSAEEAAAVMGRRAGTIRGLTFRAIASLRRRTGRGLRHGTNHPAGPAQINFRRVELDAAPDDPIVALHAAPRHRAGTRSQVCAPPARHRPEPPRRRA